jgi:cellulose synthase/poly-beta-1,6-N-acetylglucosamine synthase-like glycosyltransferase
MTMWFHIAAGIVYAYSAIGTAYMAVFAMASRLKLTAKYPSTSPRYRFLLLHPAYKEDAVICESAKASLQQDYPHELYHVCVIADHMQESTHQRLSQLGAEVLPVQFEESSKAKALTMAMDYFSRTGDERKPFDYVIILDADNVVSTNFLQQVNDYLCVTHERVVQTHRKAKNLNTPTALLDAAIEEMNNSIFRQGHVRLGISSSLIGSGMVMEYPWFLTHIHKTGTVGEDKELEAMLLSERIHIGYAAHIPVYDEKVQSPEVMKRQRRRWISTQLTLVRILWGDMGSAFRHGNVDYLIKALETVILPRSILLVLIGLMLLICLPFSLKWVLGWLLLWLILTGSMYIATPSDMRNRRLWTAVRQTPLFIFTMLGNLLKQRGAGKQFIHTQHG